MLLLSLLLFADGLRCDAHLINEGIVINEDGSVCFEWEGTGPSEVEDFSCMLDAGAFSPCKSEA